MSVKDLSIYSLVEILEMREKAIDSFKAIQKSIAGIAESEIPTKKLIELNSLQKVIDNYDKEIENRKYIETYQKKKKIPESKKESGRIGKIVMFIMLVFFVAYSMFNENPLAQTCNNLINDNPLQEVQSLDKEDCHYLIAGLHKTKADKLREQKNYRNALKHYRKSLVIQKCYCQKENWMHLYALKLIEFSDYYCTMTFFLEAEEAIHDACCTIRNNTLGQGSFEAKECEAKLSEIRERVLKHRKNIEKLIPAYLKVDPIPKQNELPSKPFN